MMVVALKYRIKLFAGSPISRLGAAHIVIIFVTLYSLVTAVYNGPAHGKMVYAFPQMPKPTN